MYGPIQALCILHNQSQQTALHIQTDSYAIGQFCHEGISDVSLSPVTLLKSVIFHSGP